MELLLSFLGCALGTWVYFKLIDPVVERKGYTLFSDAKMLVKSFFNKEDES